MQVFSIQNWKKDNYGVITYPNGEKYFGMYQKEFRNKQGIYVYQPKIEGDKLLSEFTLVFGETIKKMIMVSISGYLKIRT